jgi:hypothetical protein
MGFAPDHLPIEIEKGDLVTRYQEFDEMAIRHARVPAGVDFAPVLAGLPDDRCPSPHWGIVMEGSIHLTHGDGTEETVKAGEIYYWPSGHTAVTDEATVFIEVGPVAQMRQFSEHAKRVLA